MPSLKNLSTEEDTETQVWKGACCFGESMGVVMEGQVGSSVYGGAAESKSVEV